MLMRKNLKVQNTFQFIIITVITIAIIAMFILVINFFTKFDNKTYDIASNSNTYTSDLELIKTSKPSKMKMSFDGTYKLTSIDDMLKKTYNLGKNVVMTNNSTSIINLYGTYYEIDTDGDVKKMIKSNKVDKLGGAKLYKIADRKYLVIDKKIFSSDGSINTKDYLIIEIDKKGNATLYNDYINVKEINPMIISTSAFDINIAKETMVMQDKEINLKKVIGSTNLYKEKESKESTNEDKQDKDKSRDKEDNSISNETINNTTDYLLNKNKSLERQIQKQNDYYSNYFKTVKSSFNNLNSSLKNTNKQAYDIQVDNNRTKSSIKNYDLSRWISIGIVEPYVTSIKVNYSIFDPNNEYKTVYIDVNDGSNSQHIIINKEQSSTMIRNLTPSTEYKLTLGYSLSVDGENTTNYTNDVLNVKTLSPSYELNVTRVSSKGIYFHIKVDKEYEVESGKLNLYSDDAIIGSKNLDTGKAADGYDDFISANNLGHVIILRLEDTKVGDTPVDLNIYSKFVNGRN